MGVESGTSLGPYQILSLLGAGGMGEVYRAHDPRLGRDVAVKTIAASLAGEPDALARFQREARVIAALSHPNILAIYDIGSHNGVWYLVTELLQGETLGRRLTRGKLPWKKAVEISARVADGLARRARGVVHRDLKPENIFSATTASRSSTSVWPSRRPRRAARTPSRARIPPSPDRSSAPSDICRRSRCRSRAGRAVGHLRARCVLHEMLSGRRCSSAAAPPRRSPRS
jgi:serine/threonine protein kinase